jgi:hypothetical protein
VIGVCTKGSLRHRSSRDDEGIGGDHRHTRDPTLDDVHRGHVPHSHLRGTEIFVNLKGQ